MKPARLARRVVPLAVAVALLVSSPTLRAAVGGVAAEGTIRIERMLAWIVEVDPAVLYAVAALLTALEASLLIGLLLPGDVVVLLLGTTVTSPTRFVLAVAAVTVGSVLGEIVGYHIGRRLGGRFRQSALGRRIGPRRWCAAQRFFTGRSGRSAVFGARYVAAIHALVPIVAGSMAMSRKQFLRWTTTGAVSWSVVYVAAGAAAGVAAHEFQTPMMVLGSVLFALVLLAAGIGWLVTQSSTR